VFCAVVYLIFPNFSKIVNAYIFDSPMALFELVVSFWLLFKGLKARDNYKPDCIGEGSSKSLLFRLPTLF
jgi:4-amino-4-deoxy-L-arabinose transferase-like glycosyltransferase